MLTAVIPTRNRPQDLGKAVASVIAQTRMPDEFIIVDQSLGEESRQLVESMMFGNSSIRLIYIHDQQVTGLVDAKRVASEQATGNIVCFLEDDVVLEAEYLEQIELGFLQHPDMMGSCGVVTNMPRQPKGYHFLFHLFHRGIFKDKRVGLYERFEGGGHALIPSVMLSGGLSAWRREVFSVVLFDVANGFHMLEDIDFSTRVARHYGPHLYINPNARLAHYSSPVNREVLGPRQRRKMNEFIMYYKKRRDWPGANFALSWLMVGLFIEAIFQALKSRSVEVLGGYFTGVREGVSRKVSNPTPPSHTRLP